MKNIGSFITAVPFAFAIASATPMAANAADVILSGAVKSAAGEKLGGVMISAKGDGQTITTSIFTDENGNYYFPPMPAGKYQVLTKHRLGGGRPGRRGRRSRRHLAAVLLEYEPLQKVPAAKRAAWTPWARLVRNRNNRCGRRRRWWRLRR